MRDRIKILTIVLLFGIILTSIVSAQEQDVQSPGTYYINQDAYLFQTCDNCTFVNITNILLVNKTNVPINLGMTKVGTDYNFTLSKNYLPTEGIVIIRGNANPNGLETSWSYQLRVNNLAIEQTIPQAIGSAIFLILMVVMMFLFGGIGLRLFKSDKWWILGIFFVFFSSLLLIYNTYLGFAYHKTFTGLPDSSVPERIFWILLMVIVLGLLTSAALLFIHWKKVLRYVKKEIKRKPEGDEDLDDWDIDGWAGERWGVRDK